MDFTSQSKLFGFGKPIRVKPLSEDEAVNLGTKLVGETFVYGVSASLLLYEYNRSSNNEQIKEEKRRYDIATLQRKINEYGMITERQEAEIKEMQRKLFSLEDSNKSLATKLIGALKPK